MQKLLLVSFRCILELLGHEGRICPAHIYQNWQPLHCMRSSLPVRPQTDFYSLCPGVKIVHTSFKLKEKGTRQQKLFSDVLDDSMC